MRRWLGWTLSGLGLFLALVLLMAPAELVAALVAGTLFPPEFVAMTVTVMALPTSAATGM